MRNVLRVIGRVLAMLALSRASSAQQPAWGVGLDVGLTRFWGASEAVPPDQSPGLKPFRPTTVTVRLDRSVGRRGRVGLGVAYAASALAAEGAELAVVAKGQLAWVQLAPEAAYRFTTLRAGPELRVFGGPVADLWLPEGGDSRVRFGGRAGLEFLAPLGSAVAATVRAHGGVSGSLFREADVPSGFRTTMMPSAGAALGLRLGF